MLEPHFIYIYLSLGFALLSVLHMQDDAETYLYLYLKEQYSV